MVGKTLGHYRITAKIGTGGMGEVYQATVTKLNREVEFSGASESRIPKDREGPTDGYWGW